jgi:hypothetical protein
VYLFLGEGYNLLFLLGPDMPQRDLYFLFAALEAQLIVVRNIFWQRL